MLKRALHVFMAVILGATLGLAALPQEAKALEPTLYNQPGDHFVNGRYWRTSCDMYSTNVVRCRTEIFATKVVKYAGNYYNHNGWVFNNLTYLPSDEGQWAGNPLATSSDAWYAPDGRKWKTECNTPATGQGGCRSYAFVSDVVNEGGKFFRKSSWILNNIVQFSTASVPAQKTILPAAPAVPNMPVETAFVPPKPTAPPVNTTSFRTDSRCNTGRVLCISKNQRKMAYMIDGKIQDVVSVRFGSELTPTRNGNWTLFRKSRNHVSSLYGSAMPFAMFFSGGQAVHYSSDFNRRGYNGSSHGCVNVRDYNALEAIFNSIRVNDRVVVYN
ncbi:L,D-transpeptidase [Tessaracoccus antarcticus]|nr:L,D-transpeptidase [Tessaracoccus antarcticus]